MFTIPVFFMWQWILANSLWKMGRACEVKSRLSHEKQPSLRPFVAKYFFINVIVFILVIQSVLNIHTLTPLTDFLSICLIGAFFLVMLKYLGRWMLLRDNLVPQDIQKNLDAIQTHHLGPVPHVRAFIITLGMLFLILAVMGPEGQQRMTTLHRQSLQVVILLDLSNSMNAADVYPSRLVAVKEEIDYLISLDAYDEFALVYFTNDTFIQSPLTNDSNAIRVFAKSATTDLMPTNGTDLPKALKVAQHLLHKHDDLYISKKRMRRILLITDGENHHDEALDQILYSLRQDEIKVDVLGIGTPDGAQVFDASGKPVLYNKAPVISRYTDQIEKTLHHIAEYTNGFYIHYNLAHDAMNAFLDHSDGLRISDSGSSLYSSKDRVQLYPMFLIPAYIVAIYLVTEPVYILLLNRVRKRRKNTFDSVK